ncbi:unnamed protein product [Nesidiocoris tenuis]|uniref:Uncharacterized protein n=1 Tax=Nesidiocoris tenuis TaxID=355587 RepID=A0A6H5HVW9_9HEMI|nr:unnamed protein product [Nesidiocoris tenuis]
MKTIILKKNDNTIQRKSKFLQPQQVLAFRRWYFHLLQRRFLQSFCSKVSSIIAAQADTPRRRIVRTAAPLFHETCHGVARPRITPGTRSRSKSAYLPRIESPFGSIAFQGRKTRVDDTLPIE